MDRTVCYSWKRVLMTSQKSATEHTFLETTYWTWIRMPTGDTTVNHRRRAAWQWEIRWSLPQKSHRNVLTNFRKSFYCERSVFAFWTLSEKLLASRKTAGRFQLSQCCELGERKSPRLRSLGGWWCQRLELRWSVALLHKDGRQQSFKPGWRWGLVMFSSWRKSSHK